MPRFAGYNHVVLLDVPDESLNLIEIEAWYIREYNPVCNKIRKSPQTYGKEYKYLQDLGFFSQPNQTSSMT